MLLTVCEGEAGESERIVEPEDDQHVEQVLRELFYVEEDDRFVILADRERKPVNGEFYIQCHFGTLEIDEEYILLLEYREGSSDKHYRCLNDLSGLNGLELVVRAFVDYLHGKEDWRSGLEWERATDLIRE